MRTILFVAGLVVSAGLVRAQEVKATATTTVEVVAAEKAYEHKELYPLATCVVSDEPLDSDSVETFTVDGRVYKTCCGKCRKKVEADPAPFLAKLDAALVAQQLPHYPLDVCVVTGKKLGSMGEPVKLVLDGTLVQLCCKGCTKKATAAAAEKAAMVRDAAFQKQLAAYPTKTCVVGGHELGDDAVSVMYGTTLVRFCCAGCTDDFEKEPAKYLAKLAAAAPHGGDHEHHEHGDHGKEVAAAAAPCGTECVGGLTGSCCADQGAQQPAKTGCCGTAGGTPAPAKTGCCGTAGSAPAPKKVN